ncbi:oxidoreductase with NAD+ or NADP+ as acceptor, partial [Saitozyma sp. JCM 24511]
MTESKMPYGTLPPHFAPITTRAPPFRLGKSGLKVSKLILRARNKTHDARWDSWVLDDKTGIEHIKYAYENGINTFDYSAGMSEIILGKALKEIGAPRESVVVLTKVYNPVTIGSYKRAPGEKDLDKKGYVNQHGLSRKHIFESVQASLKRLQLDYIDLLQCHRFDYDTPIEETMQALHDVVKAGYVRYIGMSSCWAYQFQAMQNYAINNRLTPFISMQNFHNAAYREEEREMMMGVGMIPWSPLCRGFLARPWQSAETERVKSDPGYKGRGLHKPDTSIQSINERVAELAKKRGVSMAQIALAWSFANEFVTAPIIGTTKLESLKELIDGVQIQLTPEEKKYLDEPYTPRAI